MLERVGLDVGGTRVKAGRVSADGGVREERSIDVPPTAAELAGALAQLARELGAEGSIGLGLPGLLDADGTVLDSPNVPQLEGLPLRATLAEALAIAPTAVAVENDANAAALGEAWLGAARGASDVLVVTLGTGIGGGLVLGGELWRGGAPSGRGGRGLAGEIGHVRIDPAGPRCGCGGQGCLETLASATAARRRALERGLPRDAPGDLERLAEAARAGEAGAAALFVEIGRDLGLGLSTAVCLLDLRTFVVGGGFSAALDLLLPGIRAGIREGAYGERADAVLVVPAALGGSAGWIGAARLALDLARDAHD